MLLGDHDLLLYPLLQVVLLLGQHFLGLPQSVDGLLRSGSGSGPVVFGPGGAGRAGLGAGLRAGAGAAALEQFRDFAHFGVFLFCFVAQRSQGSKSPDAPLECFHGGCVTTERNFLLDDFCGFNLKRAKEYTFQLRPVTSLHLTPSRPFP